MVRDRGIDNLKRVSTLKLISHLDCVLKTFVGLLRPAELKGKPGRVTVTTASSEVHTVFEFRG